MRYTTGILLGRGGMGEVYKAWDPVLERLVALKVLHTRSNESVERLLREARAQARLEHPNICRVYEVGDDPHQPHIAMQYVEGETLDLAAQHMALEEVVTVMAQVAEAIHEAHRVGLIHRDLKPSNILVEEAGRGDRDRDETGADAAPPTETRTGGTDHPAPVDGGAEPRAGLDESSRRGSPRWTPYVVDFGLVHEQDGTRLTTEGVVMGTAPYMAPEQAQGVLGLVDRRSDVYSLGATLYELLTGHPVFEGTAMEQVLHTLHRDPTPLRRRRPQLPADLETIALRCLEKEPARRYPSARALAQDLRRFLADEPILARAPSLIYRVRKVVRRHRALTAVTTLATVALLALGAYALWTQWRAQEQALEAQAFIAEVKDVEWVMRATRMSPAHDVRPQEEALRQRLERLEARAGTARDAQAGLTRYAVGRGFLALRDDERALQHLDAAWATGVRTPELAYALGLTYGRAYQRATAAARGLDSEGAREKALMLAQQSWRDPALQYLEDSTGSASAVPQHVEGLVAFYEGNVEEALQAATDALDAAPWLYEAELLRADIFLLEADRHWETGEVPDAVASYLRARESVEAALARAPSDPAAYELRCEIAIHRLDAIIFGPGGDVETLFPPELAACEEGLTVHPDSGSLLMSLSSLWLTFGRSRAQLGTGDVEQALAPAQASLEHLRLVAPGEALLESRFAQIHSVRARFLEGTGDDPEPHWRRALEHYDAALERGENPFSIHIESGAAALRLAHHQLRTGRDGGPELERALASLERATKIDPTSSYAFNNLGRANEIAASQASRRGDDPRPPLERAAAAYRRAVELNPANTYAWSNLGVSLMTRGSAMLERGDDPTPDLEAAGEAFRQGLELNPDYAATHNNIGLAGIYRARHQLRVSESPRQALDLATEHLLRAHELQPSAFQPLTNLGRVEALRADAQNALGASPNAALQRSVDWYLFALQRNARDPDTLAELARVHLRQGRRSDAATRAQEALEVDPTHEGATEVLEEMTEANGRPKLHD